MISTAFESLIARGTEQEKPAAGIPGRLFYNTTSAGWERDSGIAWESCEPDTIAPDGVLPPGGDTGQVLAKTSPDDFAASWVDAGSGSGDMSGPGGAVDGHIAVFDGSSGKLLRDGGTPFGSPVAYPLVRTYVSDRFDGIFFALGTSGLPMYSNPGESGLFRSAPLYIPSQITNIDTARAASKATDGRLFALDGCAHTNNTASAWWKADFGAGYGLQPDRFAIWGRDTGGSHPRNWKLQGSNNDVDWTDLIIVTGAGPADGTCYSVGISSYSPFRYVRIFQTGVNSSGTNYLVLGEVEFWGTLGVV